MVNFTWIQGQDYAWGRRWTLPGNKDKIMSEGDGELYLDTRTRLCLREKVNFTWIQGQDNAWRICLTFNWIHGQYYAWGRCWTLPGYKDKFMPEGVGGLYLDTWTRLCLREMVNFTWIQGQDNAWRCRWALPGYKYKIMPEGVGELYLDTRTRLCLKV